MTREELIRAWIKNQPGNGSIVAEFVVMLRAMKDDPDALWRLQRQQFMEWLESQKLDS